MKIIFDNTPEPEGFLVPYKVERWYSRSVRSWVVQLKDKYGNQIGNAHYDGDKDGAIIEEKRLKKEYDL